MKGWKEVNIGSLGEVITGNTPLTSNRDFYGGPYPFIKPTDMEIDRRHVESWDETYSEKAFLKYKNAFIPKGATGVVTIGTVGEKLFQANQPCFTNQSVNVVIPEMNKYDYDFVYYLMKYNLPQVSAANPGTASGRHHVSKSNFCAIKVWVPNSLPTQRRIASILSAYDDLIENNLKRIKLLEELAQRTYEEWFVKFRINGEPLPIDEKTGLPEGWSVVKVKDYSEEISKGPSLNYDTDGTKFPVINQSCIRNGEIELEKVLHAQELSQSKQNCYLKINDILINSMGQGTLGRVSKNISINERFIIHNCITFVRAKETLSQYQLFYFLSSKQSYFESVAQGSTGQTTLKVSLIEDLEIPLATQKIIGLFNSNIKPLWEQMGFLKNQNQNLKESRDILLPRLMSGQINVE